MSSKLSPTARAAIRTSLSAALVASRTPAPAPVASAHPTPDAAAPNLMPRRSAKPTRIDVADLVGCVQRAIAEANKLDLRPQRPMVNGMGFEPMYRFHQHNHDRLSCFAACLSGSLSIYAPDAAAEIAAFLDKGHSLGATAAHDTNHDALERTTTCQQ